MIPGSANPLLLASAEAGAYEIERSVRFNSSDSAYLSRTPASAGNRRTFTWAAWVKLTNFGSDQVLFAGWDGSAPNQFEIRFQSDNTFSLNTGGNSGSRTIATTAAVFRDPSAWYHLTCVVDTTQASASNHFKFYVNNVLQTLTLAESGPQNLVTQVNGTFLHHISVARGLVRYFNGCLADCFLIDGQALDPTSFGEFDDNGIWQPKAYTGGSYGTNGFHLDFSDNSTAAALGTDTSGNGNTWTVNNISNVDVSELIYAGSATAAVGGVVPNGGTPYWIDILPTTADLAYSGGPGMDVVHDGNLSTFVYWVGDDYASGNVTQARFDLRDFPTVTSVRVYAEQPFTGGSYTPYSARLLDAGKSVIAGSSVTINSTSPDWHNLAVSGSPRYIEFYRVSPNAERINLRAIEVNGQILTDTPASTSDSLVDVPTNGTETDTGVGGEVRGNYCTLNPLANPGSSTLSNGNLDVVTASAGYGKVNGTIAVSSGKWYWEVVCTVRNQDAFIGIEGVTNANTDTYTGGSATGTGWYNGGTIYSNASYTSYGTPYAANDVIGVALDMDAGTLVFYKNGVSAGTAKTGLSGSYTASVSDGATSGSGNTYVHNFGQRPFAYTAPSGFKALCTANLPAPVVTKPSEYMDVKLYTGNGSTQTISGLEFSPDLVWGKKRNGTTYHNLVDVVRGANKEIYSNDTLAETTPATAGLTAFNSDGFDLGANSGWNANNDTYVAWTWDAGSNSSKTYTVTVPGGIGGGFYIDGDQKPTINLEEGSTYTFDQSDSSNSGHPFKFSETSDGTHGAGTEYTTNVTTFGTPGSAGAYTRIEVAASAPTLYYYCSNHSAMGGQINTNSTAGASNFDGSIPSVVRANPSAGFSIVTWTGNGSATGTVGHGLGVTPALYIVKSRSNVSIWAVFHSLTGSFQFLDLSSTAANGTPTQSAPTSTVLNVVSAFDNANGVSLVAYCFAPVDGYSNGFSYTGNGSADGSFVYLGFRPRLILLKCSSTTGNWTLVDTAREGYNVDNDPLYPNLSNAEGTTDLLDITSNGFKLRTTDASVNSNAATYIGFAWAESPFNYSRAR